MNEKRIEILAPAGSPAMGHAVVAAGADAVYFAGEQFGARAYANNFTKEEAAGFLDLVHLHGKKAYLAVNTLLKNKEMEARLYEELCYYYKAGVDAVLVQDYGVLERLRLWFPDLAIHASTQMNITTTYGADYLAGQGVRRIVLARELSLAEIRRICRECDVEIEVFVHGALCVCYSGNCLLSSFLGGRSGNRGRCAQPCRLPYRLTDPKGRRLKMPGKFLLSPKDLCTLSFLPELLDAGVCSLKIEGRMKQPYYAAAVTSIYRKYVDLYENGCTPDEQELQKDLQLLKDSGNRGGFTAAYLKMRNSPEMMSFSDSSHENKGDRGIPLQHLQPILVQGTFTAGYQKPVRLTVSCGENACKEYTAEGLLCERANNQPTSREVVRQKLTQSQDGPFVIGSLTIDMEDGLFIPHKELKRLRREALSQLLKFTAASFHRPVYDRKQTVCQKDQTSVREDDKAAWPEIYVRIHDRKQLLRALSQKGVDRIIIPCSLADEAQKAGGTDETLIYSLPVVLRQEELAYYEAFIRTHPKGQYEVSSFDALGLTERLQVDRTRLYGGFRLYMLSNRTRTAYLKRGIKNGCIPLELSEKELRHRYNKNDRMLIYGRIPLMYMANCVAKNAGACHGNTKAQEGFYHLWDRKGKSFPVFCDCRECVNTLYNADTLFLLDQSDRVRKLGCRAVELSFSTESPEEMKDIFSDLDEFRRGGKDVAFPKTFTRGHFGHSVD